MIAVTVNEYTKDANNKQMQNSKQIAIVQLRNDIYKEFSNYSLLS
jgi:predicted lactoylglutathione lyase